MGHLGDHHDHRQYAGIQCAVLSWVQYVWRWLVASLDRGFEAFKIR
jgi:hypothetical protein